MLFYYKNTQGKITLHREITVETMLKILSQCTKGLFDFFASPYLIRASERHLFSAVFKDFKVLVVVVYNILKDMFCVVPVYPSCSEGEFECRHLFGCVGSEQFCDGHADCWDQSDEPDNCHLLCEDLTSFK